MGFRKNEDDYDIAEYEDYEEESGGVHFGRMLLMILVVVLVIGGFAYGILRKYFSPLSTLTQASADADESADADDGTADNAIITAEEEDEEVEEETGEQDFVIFGVDTRSTNLSSGTRSDSIMIIHIDHDEKTVKVLSIYRDCMVSIEGHGYEKITHAHSYGGPDLAVSTINDNFDLDIENYVTVNFINVADLIDEIGGIEQDITEAETKYINSYISELNSIRGTSSAEITEAGTYLLDGTQAVAFTRIRYTSGGDYKRTERQRTILFSVFEAAKEMSAADRLSLAEDMIGDVNTNFDEDDLVSLLYYLSKYEITDMGAYPEVFYGGKVDGAWVEVPVTLVDMVSSMHEFLYDETDYEPSETVESISSTLYGKASTANNDMRDDEEE